MGSVVSAAVNIARFVWKYVPVIIRCLLALKDFLLKVLMILELIEQIIKIGKLIIKLFKRAGTWIASFFSSDSAGDQGDDDQDTPLATTRVDKDNIDSVVRLAERLQSQQA